MITGQPFQFWLPEVRKVTERLNLGTEFKFSYPDKDGCGCPSAGFFLVWARIQAWVWAMSISSGTGVWVVAKNAKMMFMFNMLQGFEFVPQICRSIVGNPGDLHVPKSQECTHPGPAWHRWCLGLFNNRTAKTDISGMFSNREPRKIRQLEFLGEVKRFLEASLIFWSDLPTFFPSCWGKVSCCVHDAMGFGFSGVIDYARGDYKLLGETDCNGCNRPRSSKEVQALGFRWRYFIYIGQKRALWVMGFATFLSCRFSIYLPLNWFITSVFY